jgi:beta-1,3-glucuronyltransferase P
LFPFLKNQENIRYSLLSQLYTAPMPQKYRTIKPKPRGVSNRNRALEWIRANATDGVIYFADDDNTYDLDIFKEVQYI